MNRETSKGGSVRDRILVALTDPQLAGRAGALPATLVAFHEPMTVFEWLGTGKGLVLLDYHGISEGDLRTQVDRVLAAHERGLLIVLVAGGGAEVEPLLRAADADCRNRDQTGLYHLDESGKLRRAAGRRLPELERAAHKLPESGQLSPEEVAGIMERGRTERQEAMAFVQGTSRRFPHVTAALIAACVLMFAITSGSDLRARSLYLLLWNDPVAVRHGEVWRLLSYAFLHDRSNLTHIIVNMLSLYSLGAFLEPLLGRWRFALLYLATALAGGIASTLLTEAPSVGASGAVWGLLGATYGLLGRREPLFPALIARGLRKRLVVILAINIVLSFLPGIDRYCHFGGGLAGYLIARFLPPRPVQPTA